MKRLLLALTVLVMILAGIFWKVGKNGDVELSSPDPGESAKIAAANVRDAHSQPTSDGIRKAIANGEEENNPQYSILRGQLLQHTEQAWAGVQATLEPGGHSCTTDHDGRWELRLDADDPRPKHVSYFLNPFVTARFELSSEQDTPHRLPRFETSSVHLKGAKLPLEDTLLQLEVLQHLAGGKKDLIFRKQRVIQGGKGVLELHSGKVPLRQIKADLLLPQPSIWFASIYSPSHEYTPGFQELLVPGIAVFRLGVSPNLVFLEIAKPLTEDFPTEILLRRGVGSWRHIGLVRGKAKIALDAVKQSQNTNILALILYSSGAYSRTPIRIQDRDLTGRIQIGPLDVMQPDTLETQSRSFLLLLAWKTDYCYQVTVDSRFSMRGERLFRRDGRIGFIPPVAFTTYKASWIVHEDGRVDLLTETAPRRWIGKKIPWIGRDVLIPRTVLNKVRQAPNVILELRPVGPSWKTHWFTAHFWLKTKKTRFAVKMSQGFEYRVLINGRDTTGAEFIEKIPLH